VTLTEQENGERIIFVAEYEGKVSGICTLVLHPHEGPFAGKGYPEIVDLGVWYQGKQLDQYAPCVNDDDLLLFMSKKLR